MLAIGSSTARVHDTDGAVEASPDGDVVVRLAPRRALWIAAATLAVLNAANAVVLASRHTDLPVLPRLSDWLLLARENNPSTWFSSALFLLAAALAILLALQTKGGEIRDNGEPMDDDAVQRRGWWLLVAGFVFISLDEAASVHEHFEDTVIEPLVEGRGVLDAVWWVPLVPVGVALLLVLRRFWRTLDRQARRVLLAAGTLYVSGAALVEGAAQLWAEDHGQDLRYHLITTVEENLEMLAAVLLVAGLAAILRRRGRTVRLDL